MRRMKRSEEHTSELQSPIDISYAVFCLKKKKYEVRRLMRTSRARPITSKARTVRNCSRASGSVFISLSSSGCFFFFFNDTATTEIYTSIDTLSLHDALPIWTICPRRRRVRLLQLVQRGA